MIGSSESLSTIGELVALRLSFWRELDSSSELSMFPLSMFEYRDPRAEFFELSDLLTLNGLVFERAARLR
jgi:hypothetical protein